MSEAASAPLLACKGIGKSFGRSTVLSGVDFTVEAGEIHGLVGCNGAGKSTLMKILAGVHSEHEGTIEIRGTPVRLRSPQEALAQGIAMVYQELSGIGQLSVAENLFLGRQPVKASGLVNWRRMRDQAESALAELDIRLDVRRRLADFPLVVRQMVEIARGLHSGARILILDEPTSALSPPEVHRLFDWLIRLGDHGVAMIYISHFIEDVLQLCGRVSVLRDGKRVLTAQARELDKDQVIRVMLGRELETDAYSEERTLSPPSEAPPVLSARNLSRAGAFRDVQFEVAAGECLGIYGFVGAGHQELCHVLAGSLATSGGELRVASVRMPGGDLPTAVEAGVALVAGDRSKSLFQSAPVYQNVTLAHLAACVGNWLTRYRELKHVLPVLERVGCRPFDPDLATQHLSGGNQQKVVLARWLLGSLRVLILDEPTRGMDVGAKDEIIEIVASLLQSGTAVILASSEPELVLRLSDRILVMKRGRIVVSLSNVGVDKETLMRHA
jgi:ribose transport system ATP-binding protein